MGFAGNTLDLIRTVFNRTGNMPVGPSYFDSLNYNAISYSNVTLGPQNGYNDYLTDSVKLDQDLMSRYADYEDMDDFPELGSALDLYSDDATVQDVLSGKSMWFEAEDMGVENALNDMLTVNLKAEEHLWELTRSLCKYGNEFNEIMVLDKIGVIRLNHIPAPSIRRIEDVNGILYGYIHDPTMVFRMDTQTFMTRLKEKGAGELSPIPQDGDIQDLMEVYEPWEVVHFRLRGKARRDLYGYSALEAARWAWKRLTMLEDAMVLYKLTRSPQRYAYYVDVGDVPPNQAKGFLNKIKNEFKKTKFIDPDTGKPSFRYNPLSMDEDIFIPVRKGKRSTEIDVLAGPEGQQVDDAEYFLNKIFAALKIPKSYLGADETIGRANLCLVPETKICLADGRVLTMEDLIEEHKQGKQNFVYSRDKNLNIVSGKIKRAGWTRLNADVCRVFLKGGEYIDATPDHPFMLYSGEFKNAAMLVPGQDILMPIDPSDFKNGVSIEGIERLEDRRDCCDIEVEEFHNFATQAGVFVHNSQMDVRFARTVMRIQREVKNGHGHVARVDLSAKNIDPDRVDYECHMVIPSGVFELAQMEVQQAKLELAQRYKDAEFSEYYIWSEVLGLSDEDITKVQQQRARERESDLDGEESEQVRELMPKAVDKAQDKMDKKTTEKTQQILSEINKGQTNLGKRLKEVKKLTTEITHAISNQKHYRGRKK